MLRDDQPIFNLRAVVQETGVKPDTLRAWERRYGVPLPQRTEGGHRLYSRKDIRTIQWLLAQRDAGLSISQAVELWTELEATSDPPTLESAYVQEAGRRPDEHVDTVSRLRQRWISAALGLDEERARQTLSEAFALFPLEFVCSNILMAGLGEIGRDWYEAKATVQQEHFATELVIRQLETLNATAPSATRTERILAACPPHEDHVAALLFLTLLLRRRGWQVVYLGANVPVADITDTIRDGDFSLVISSAQQLYSAATLMGMASALADIDVPVAYGGRIFNLMPGLRERIPGTFLGERIEDAVHVVEKIMIARPSPVPVEQPPESFKRALDHYRQRITAIEGTVEDELADNGITGAQLRQANRSLHDDISAALLLGSMQYLNNEVEWINGLLRNHNVPVEYLDRYFHAYQEALKIHLDDRGAPISEWMEQTV
ncbi:MAG: MerR family transcriptional regulator [Caldilineaceae bacterium]